MMLKGILNHTKRKQKYYEIWPGDSELFVKTQKHSEICVAQGYKNNLEEMKIVRNVGFSDYMKIVNHDANKM